MEKKYMIVRITKTSNVQFNAEETLTESCFDIFNKDFETPESAVDEKNKYTNPSQFIVVPYYV